MYAGRRFALIFGIPLLGVALGLVIAGAAILTYVGLHSLTPTAVDMLITLGGTIALFSFVLFLINIPIAIYLAKNRHNTSSSKTL